MFCPNCGTELPDDSVFCGACGARLDDNGAESVNAASEVPNPTPTPAPMSNQTPYQQPAAGKKGGKTIGMVVAAVVVVALVVVVAMKAFGGNYKKPINDLCSLVNKKETKIEKYVDAVAPKFAANAYRNGVSLLKEVDEIADALDELEEEMKDTFDDAKDTYGSNYKMKAKITDKEKISKDDLKDIRNNYKSLRQYLGFVQEGGLAYGEIEDALSSSALKKYDKLIDDLDDDLSDLKITDGYALEVELTISGKEDEDSTEINVNVIKVNGKWCLDFTSGDANVMSQIGF